VEKRVGRFEARGVLGDDVWFCVCGVNKRLHGRVDERCPQPARVATTLESARVALEEAEKSGDPARVFVARGEVQRLGGGRQSNT